MKFLEGLKSLLDRPNGLTAGDLKLRPGFQNWFKYIAEYQEIVGALQ
jgi:hypothetical protein